MQKSAILNELEEALTSGTSDKLAKTLQRVTDLFVFGASNFSGGHIALFDGVFNHLVADIDTSARAALAERLGPLPNAPAGIIRTLAFDDEISVAGPVLASSINLDNASLVENARTKSQPHLLAISGRPTLAETVTDVLVERGDRDVALRVAGNAGARFSETGYLRLVKRSQGDDELTKTVGLRSEIPRQHFLKLLTTASKAVRMALEAAHPDLAGHVEDVVNRVATNIQTHASTSTRDYASARILVEDMRRSNNLSERDIETFARAGRFEEVAASLALLGDLPLALVERAMVLDREETMLLVAKAVGLSWSTTRTLLFLCAGKGGVSADTLERCRESYNKMKQETAVKVIAFQRGRRQD